MLAQSEQALGSKKPFFFCPGSHSFLSSSARLAAGAVALPLRAALQLSPPPQPGASLPRPGWQGSAQPLAGSPQSLSLMLSWREGWSQRYSSVLDSSRSNVFEQASLSSHRKRRNVTQVLPCSLSRRARGGMGGRMAGLETGTLGRRAGGADGDPSPLKAGRGGRWGWPLATSKPGLGHSQVVVRACPSVRPLVSPPERRALRIPSPRPPLSRPAAYRLLLAAVLEAADHQVGVEHRLEGAGALGPAVAEGLHAAVVAPVAHRAHGAGPHAPRAAVDAVDTDHPAGGGGGGGRRGAWPPCPALPALPAAARSAAAAAC